MRWNGHSHGRTQELKKGGVLQARSKGAENESPYRRLDGEAEGVEVDAEWVSPSPAAYRFLGNVVSSPSVVRGGATAENEFGAL